MEATKRVVIVWPARVSVWKLHVVWLYTLEVFQFDDAAFGKRFRAANVFAVPLVGERANVQKTVKILSRPSLVVPIASSCSLKILNVALSKPFRIFLQ